MCVYVLGSTLRKTEVCVCAAAARTVVHRGADVALGAAAQAQTRNRERLDWAGEGGGGRV